MNNNFCESFDYQNNNEFVATVSYLKKTTFYLKDGQRKSYLEVTKPQDMDNQYLFEWSIVFHNIDDSLNMKPPCWMQRVLTQYQQQFQQELYPSNTLNLRMIESNWQTSVLENIKGHSIVNNQVTQILNEVIQADLQYYKDLVKPNQLELTNPNLLTQTIPNTDIPFGSNLDFQVKAYMVGETLPEAEVQSQNQQQMLTPNAEDPLAYIGETSLKKDYLGRINQITFNYGLNIIPREIDLYSERPKFQINYNFKSFNNQFDEKPEIYFRVRRLFSAYQEEESYNYTQYDRIIEDLEGMFDININWIDYGDVALKFEFLFITSSNEVYSLLDWGFLRGLFKEDYDIVSAIVLQQNQDNEKLKIEEMRQLLQSNNSNSLLNDSSALDTLSIMLQQNETDSNLAIQIIDGIQQIVSKQFETRMNHLSKAFEVRFENSSRAAITKFNTEYQLNDQVNLGSLLGIQLFDLNNNKMSSQYYDRMKPNYCFEINQNKLSQKHCMNADQYRRLEGDHNHMENCGIIPFIVLSILAVLVY